MKAIIILLVIIISYNANCQYLQLFDIDTTNFPIMKAKFYASDIDGNQILNLSPSDFELKEDGQTRIITNISCPTPKPPVALSSVLTIDVSGSMEGNGLINAKAAAKAWVEGLPLGNSECAITSFNSLNYFNQDFTTDKNKLLNAINLLNAGGGTSFDAGFINPLAGALIAAENAKYKKVVVFITDGLASGNESAIIQKAKQINATVYCVTLNMDCPKILKNIAEQTVGQWFENVTTIKDAIDVYNKILQIAQNSAPCTIEWESGFPCSIVNKNIELTLLQNGTKANSNYQSPNSVIAKLEFNPTTIRFENPPVGTPVNQTITITAQNSAFNVTNVTSSNPAYSISPTNFKLDPYESRDLTVTYTAADSGYVFSRFTFENDICPQNYFASGGYNRVKPKTPTIKLTHPNGGENFVIGSDTIITWEGISASDTVRLEYSIDNGASWKNITNSATGLKYDWKNVPKPVSNQCLIKVSQLEKISSSSQNDSVRTLTGHINIVNSIAFSPDGNTLASGGFDQTIKLWDVSTGQEIRTMTYPVAAVYNIAYNPDGSTLASGSNDKIIKLWDVATGQEIGTLTGHNGKVYSVAYSPDGNTLASGSLDQTIKLWDVTTEQEIYTLTGPTSHISDVAYSPDGNTLASGSLDGTIKLWDVATVQEIRTLTAHTTSVTSVAFSPDGSTLASGSSDKTIKLWDIASGQEIRTLTGHTGAVIKVAISPDGSTLASGSNDKIIKLWDVATGQEIGTLIGHTDYVSSVAFSPDGSTIASGSFDKTIKLWEINTPILQHDQSDAVFSIVAPLVNLQDIDMGQVLVGSSKDSVIVDFISNIGTWKCRIDSIYFQGADATAFSLVSGFPEYTIEPNNTHFAEFSFKPNKVGIHNAEVVIITQADTLIHTIRGNGVNPQLEIITELIDFGLIEIGDEKIYDKIAVIKNLSNQDIEITDVIQLGPDLLQFEILDGGGNFIIPSKQEHEMRLRFKPQFGGRTSGQIGFEYNSFASPAIAQLFGTGIGGKLLVENYEAYAGDEINIGLKLQNIKPSGLAEIAPKFRAKVQVNNTLLYTNAGKIIENDGDLITYEFEGYIGDSEYLYEIPMKVGLGNAIACDINILEVELLDATGQTINYDMELNSGLFTLLGVCYEGGVRLISPNSIPVQIVIHPNPSNGNVNIEFTLIEKGNTDLSIIDYEGKLVYQTKVNSEPGTISMDLNTDKFPNGIYSVILQTPTIKSSQQLLIVK